MRRARGIQVIKFKFIVRSRHTKHLKKKKIFFITGYSKPYQSAKFKGMFTQSQRGKKFSPSRICLIAILVLSLIRTRPAVETAMHYPTVLLCLAFSGSPLKDQKTSKMLHTGFGSSLDGTPTGLIDVLMKKDAKRKILDMVFADIPLGLKLMSTQAGGRLEFFS